MFDFLENHLSEFLDLYKVDCADFCLFMLVLVNLTEFEGHDNTRKVTQNLYFA